MTGIGAPFYFTVTSGPDGFTVSATADRAPVRVTLRRWGWRIASADLAPGDVDLPVVCIRSLVDQVANQMCRGLFTQSRAANVRVKHVVIPRTARCIHHRVLGEVKQLLDQVPDEVLATQRAMFAVTFSAKPSLAPSPVLYQPEFAMLRRDVRQILPCRRSCGRRGESGWAGPPQQG
jgi:hypothetical protein